MMGDLLFRDDFTAMLVLAGLFLLLFLAAELLYRVGKVRAEITRKMVHVGTGLLTLLFPLMLRDVTKVGLLCGLFYLILLLAVKKGWLPSIHAISRKSNGSLLYPVAVFGVFVFYSLKEQLELPLFYTPILILAICDPLAAFVGKRWSRGSGVTGKKTWAGSTAFFLAAAGIIWLNQKFIGAASAGDTPNPLLDVRLGLLLQLAMALLTTLAERISSSGWDNLTIPAAAVGIYLLGYALT